MKRILVCMGFLMAVPGFSQEDPEAIEKALRASNNITHDANEDLADNNFIDAEAKYRRAISKSGENAAARYNMGNAYYEKDNMGEAFMRYKQAGEVAESKFQKHKAYHNMGNVFMKNKEYEKAVESYKEALRNDPSDEETRYNLALAKEMLKKQQQEQQNDKNDQNQDQQNNEDKEDKQDKKDDQGKDKEQQDNEGEEEGKDDKQNENKEGEGDKEEEKNQDQQQKGDKPEDKQQKQQPRPSQLSPQQIKNILDAMNNEEKKVQEKMNAKKVKGTPVKAEKDW